MNKRNIIITILSVLILVCIFAFARTTTTDLGLIKPTWEAESPEYDILVDFNANMDILEALANDPLEFDTGERLEDRAGVMWTGNTETGITATYQDADNTIDLVIGADDIVQTMLKCVNEPTDEDIFTYESTTGDFEWHTLAELSIQPLDATLTALAGLTISANSLIYGTGADAFSVLACNATATNKFLRQVSSGAPAWETIADGDVPNDITIDLATLATTATTANEGDAAVNFFGVGVSAVTDATTCTDIEGTYLSITTGTLNVSGLQPLDTALTNISALAYVSPSLIKLTANDTYAVRTLAEVKTDLSLNNVTNDAQIAKSIGTAQGDLIYFTASATPTVLPKGIATQVLTMNAGATAPEWAAGGGGYTNLTSFVEQTAWRVFYSNTAGDVVELALGADGTYLKSNGAAAAPTFTVPGGAGDVVKVGTPANDQVGVWTGDGTIEGHASFTYASGTGTVTVTEFIGGGAGITGVLKNTVEDTTPQLGGQLQSGAHSINFTEQVLTPGTAVAWNLGNSNKAILTPAQNFTITITAPSGALNAQLIVTQDGTGTRVMDEIITQADATVATTDVHTDTEIIDLTIDIPTGARIRIDNQEGTDVPAPLVENTIYYAIRSSENHIQVATTKANAIAGTNIDISDQGTGTHTVEQLVKWTGGTLGVLSTAAGSEDILSLTYKTADKQWYAQLAKDFQ